VTNGGPTASTKVSFDPAATRRLLEQRFNIQKVEDWYGVVNLRREAIKLLGTKIHDALPAKEDSPFGIALLRQLYAEHSWEDWKFKGNLPSKWFNDAKNLRDWFEWASKELNRPSSVKTEVFWSRIRPNLILRLLGGRRLLQHHGSLSAALSVAYPHHPWGSKLETPQQSQKELAASIKEALCVQVPPDWYSVTMARIDKLPQNLKSSFKVHFGGSLYFLASACEAPEHIWEPWKFEKAPKSFWRSSANRKRYLSSISKSLGFDADNLEQWYSVDPADVFTHNGKLVLQSFPRLIDLMKSVFPNHQWDPSRFLRQQVKSLSTESPGSARKIAEVVAINLKLLSTDSDHSFDLEKWYDVSAKQFKASGGATLILEHQGSLLRALAAAYPEHQWHGFLFKHLSHGFFDDAKNRAECLHFLEAQMGISSPAHWTGVSQRDVVSRCPKYAYAFSRLVRYCEGSLWNVLREVYPDHLSLFASPDMVTALFSKKNL
jgi:hypothetical protein